MSVRVILQSRLSSSRLPAKSLLPIKELPLVVLAARRAANKGHSVIVATSIDTSDDLLVKVLIKNNLNYIRGDLNNVLKRFHNASKDLNEDDIVVRLCADNVFPDGFFIEELVNFMEKHKLDYLGTNHPFDNLPYGVFAQAFRVKTLRNAMLVDTSELDKEHVTPWIIKNYSKLFFKSELVSDINYGHLSCSIDTLEDFLKVNRVFENVTDCINISWLELCKILSNLPISPKVRLPLASKNGKLYSKLSLGTVQVGLKYGITNDGNLIDDDESIELFKYAYNNGINIFDTAAHYGLSEERIGEFTNRFKPRDLLLVTKLSAITKFESKQINLDFENLVLSQIYKSCRNLRLKTLPVVLLHNWSDRFNNSIWETLLYLKSNGVIQELGVSVQNPIEAVEALNDPDIKHIQLPYNLLDWRWKKAKIHILCKQRGDVVIYSRSALLQGLLTLKSTNWPEIANLNTKEIINKINYFVTRFNRKDAIDLCLAYVRSQTWIDSLVVGCENINQLKQNIEYFSKIDLTKSQLAEIEAFFNNLAPEQLLNPSSWVKN